ncbi:MAG TPA: phytoene/squalene synthase family protein [Gemmatimonadaceae bacterium]|nr:phytoene/squalene synthase family protein [Gemmatimonadaceae bacterium]
MSRDDALLCERIVREHARTFSLASRFLPPGKRRATFALYAFCRTADDIVDASRASSLASGGGAAAAAGAAGAARRLAAFEAELALALAGRPSTSLFRELHRAVREFDVPTPVLFELLAGVARDLGPVRYRSWPELVRYCEGVASTVGEMCTQVFGTTGGGESRADALRYARVLGVAMQLTNILRDVGEDARARRRCYLAEEDLEAFGVSRAEVLDAHPSLALDPRWRSLMAFLVGRARALYEAAAPGIALLDPDARQCAAACSMGYAAILSAIERRGYDTLSGRARVGSWARAAILWEVVRSGHGVPALRAPSGTTPPYRLLPAKLGAPKLVNWA